MAIKQLTNKIELSFWHLAISLLTDSRLFQQAIKWGYSYIQKIENWEKIKNRVYWIIFGSSIATSVMVIAMISLIFFGVLNKASTQLIPPFSMPTNGQKNILVIGVDDLESKYPRLAAIWLLIYFPDNPNITFAPIYPDLLGSSSSANSMLVESFALNEDGSPHFDFVEQLHQKQLWWHGYVVIDTFAVSEANDFFVQASGKENNRGNNPIDSKTRGDEFPPGISAQTDLLNNLCRQAASIPVETDISRILNLVPTHFRTDMKMISIIQDWRSLVSQESHLLCEFPIQKASIP